MYILIGDIGNTITKVCLVNSKSYKVKKINFFNSEKISSNLAFKYILKKIIKNNNVYKLALFSSVVPNYLKIMKIFLKTKYKIKVKEIKDKDINKVVKINIKNKNEVGSDRIANAVGAYKKYKSNCIILDFGTATTFDVVTKNGMYNGGVIAPGVNLSLKSLVSSADQLPYFSLKKQKTAVGKSTLEALRSGFYWGYSGLINNVILKIEQETKKKYKLIFTGGYAGLFNNSINKSFTIDRNVTINGLIEIYKTNRKLFFYE